MPLTNYPNGFLAGLTVRGVPILQSQPGNVYWVDNSPPGPTGIGNTYQIGGLGTNISTRFSGGSDNNPGSFQKPFATIAQALNVCSQGAGDIILVKPGHVETCNGAPGTTGAVNMAPVYDPTGLIPMSIGGSAGYNFSMNVAGVAIVGLGAGSNRPIINFTTATGATINVSATDMSIQNFQFLGDYAAVVSAFTEVDCSIATGIVTGNVLSTGAITRSLYAGAELIATSANGIIPGTVVLKQLTGAAGAVGTYVVSQNYPVASTSATVIAGPTNFAIDNCEFRDLGTALNFLAGVTTGGGANGSDGLWVTNTRHISIASSGAISLIVLASNIDRLVARDNFSVSAAAITGGAIIAGGGNNMTGADIGRNKVFRPTVTASTAIVVSSSSTACTGLMYDNYGWCLGATSLLINTGTKLGFTNNYSSITGTADKQSIINPAQA